jgi:hypothetical protein
MRHGADTLMDDYERNVFRPDERATPSVGAMTRSEPHPQRCETCGHRILKPIGSRVCKKILVDEPKALQIGIPYFINIVGCASHSSIKEIIT